MKKTKRLTHKEALESVLAFAEENCEESEQFTNIKNQILKDINEEGRKENNIQS